MYKSILVPFDKSSHAQNALKTAIDLARLSPEATVTLLYVAEIADLTDPTFEAAAQMAGVSRVSSEMALEAQRAFYKAQKEALIEQATPLIEGFDRVEYRVTSGKPQDAIVEIAETGKFDLLVMGNRGLGALRGAIGSVSYAVLRSVEVPVLIVK